MYKKKLLLNDFKTTRKTFFKTVKIVFVSVYNNLIP